MTPSPTPTICRLVHYRNLNGVCAAMIVDVITTTKESREEGRVTLRVFSRDAETEFPAKYVRYHETEMGCWFWPPIVKTTY